MRKAFYTIFITINIVKTIAISLFCFLFFFFLGPLGLSVLLLSNVTLIKLSLTYQNLS